RGHPPGPIHPSMPKPENRALMLLAALATIGFAWVLYPFFGVILWGIVIAVVFHPMNLRLRRAMKNRKGRASIATLAIVTVLVIIPLLLVSASMAAQASHLYQLVQSGELDFVSYAQRIVAALPAWAREVLNYFNL